MSPPTAPAPAPTLSWDVTSEAVQGAFDLYRESMADWYAIEDVAHDGRSGFVNRTRATLFPNGAVGRGRSVGQTMRRAAADIRRSGLDTVNVIVDWAGMVGDCDGVNVRGSPGAVHFRDLTRPAASHVPHVDVVTMMVPRDTAPLWMTDGSAHGLMLPADGAAGRLLAAHMTVLSDVAAGLTPEEGAAAIESVFLIAGQALGRMRSATPAQAAAIHRTVRVRADAVIARRLFDPALDAASLSREAGVSRSTLYRAFAPHGGVDRRIQAARLTRARDALRRRVGRSPTVAEIACAHGFVSEAHFSRLFRVRFGHSPRETAPLSYRAAPALAVEGAIGHQAVLDWLRDGAR